MDSSTGIFVWRGWMVNEYERVRHAEQDGEDRETVVLPGTM